MAAGDEQDLIEAVVTCEGNLHDPDFQDRFRTLVDNLKSALYISKTKDPFRVRKIEPWNSVRVTISIPKEAAQKLKLLAQQGSNVLRSMGILSVQVEGDQVISLTWAAQNNETTQVILRQTSDESAGSSGTSGVSSSSLPASSPSISSISSSVASISSPIPLTPGPSGDSSGMSATLEMLSTTSSSSSLAFRSPNVVAPCGESIPVLPPKAAATSVRPALGGPFPFVSMTHAAQAIQRSELSPNSGSNAANSTNSIVSSVSLPSTTLIQGSSKSLPPPQSNLPVTVPNNSLTSGASVIVSSPACNIVTAVNMNSEPQVTRLIIESSSGLNSTTKVIGSNVGSLGVSGSNNVALSHGPTQSLQLQLVNVPPPYPGVNTISSNHLSSSSSHQNNNLADNLPPRNQQVGNAVSNAGISTHPPGSSTLPIATTIVASTSAQSVLNKIDVPTVTSVCGLSDSTSVVPPLTQPVSSPLLVNLLQNSDIPAGSSSSTTDAVNSQQQKLMQKNTNLPSQGGGNDSIQTKLLLQQSQQSKKTKRGITLDGASKTRTGNALSGSDSVLSDPVPIQKPIVTDSTQFALPLPSSGGSSVTMNRVSVPVTSSSDCKSSKLGSSVSLPAPSDTSSTPGNEGKTIVQGNIRLLNESSEQIRTIPVQQQPPTPQLPYHSSNVSMFQGKSAPIVATPSAHNSNATGPERSLLPNGPLHAPVVLQSSSKIDPTPSLKTETNFKPTEHQQQTPSDCGTHESLSTTASHAADQSRTLLPITTVNIVSASSSNPSCIVNTKVSKDSDSKTFIPPPDPRLSSQVQKPPHGSNSVSAKNSSATSNLVVQTTGYNSDAKSSTSQLHHLGRTAVINKRLSKDRPFMPGQITSPGKPRQFLINPLTGHLEPMPSESSSESEEGDESNVVGETGRKSNSHKSSFIKNKIGKPSSLPPGFHHRQIVTTESGVTVARVVKASASVDPSIAQSLNEVEGKKVVGSTTSGKGSPLPGSTSDSTLSSVMSVSKKAREDSTSAALHVPKELKDSNSPATVTATSMTGEKIKLRLKLEKNEPISPAYKVDVSFVRKSEKSTVIPISSGASSTSSVSSLSAASSTVYSQTSAGDPPRVPPLHISLRGKNAAVVVSPRREEKDMPPPTSVGSSGNTKESLVISSKDPSTSDRDNLPSLTTHAKSMSHQINSHDGKSPSGKSSSSTKRVKNKVKSFDNVSAAGKANMSGSGEKVKTKISRPKLNKEVSSSKAAATDDDGKDSVHLTMPVLQPAVFLPGLEPDTRKHGTKQNILVPPDAKILERIEGKVPPSQNEKCAILTDPKESPAPSTLTKPASEACSKKVVTPSVDAHDLKGGESEQKSQIAKAPLPRIDNITPPTAVPPPPNNSKSVSLAASPDINAATEHEKSSECPDLSSSPNSEATSNKDESVGQSLTDKRQPLLVDNTSKCALNTDDPCVTKRESSQSQLAPQQQTSCDDSTKPDKLQVETLIKDERLVSPVANLSTVSCDIITRPSPMKCQQEANAEKDDAILATGFQEKHSSSQQQESAEKMPVTALSTGATTGGDSAGKSISVDIVPTNRGDVLHLQEAHEGVIEVTMGGNKDEKRDISKNKTSTVVVDDDQSSTESKQQGVVVDEANAEEQGPPEPVEQVTELASAVCTPNVKNLDDTPPLECKESQFKDCEKSENIEAVSTPASVQSLTTKALEPQEEVVDPDPGTKNVSTEDEAEPKPVVSTKAENHTELLDINEPNENVANSAGSSEVKIEETSDIGEKLCESSGTGSDVPESAEEDPANDIEQSSKTKDEESKSNEHLMQNETETEQVSSLVVSKDGLSSDILSKSPTCENSSVNEETNSIKNSDPGDHRSQSTINDVPLTVVPDEEVCKFLPHHAPSNANKPVEEKVEGTVLKESEPAQKEEENRITETCQDFKESNFEKPGDSNLKSPTTESEIKLESTSEADVCKPDALLEKKAIVLNKVVDSACENILPKKTNEETPEAKPELLEPPVTASSSIQEAAKVDNELVKPHNDRRKEQDLGIKEPAQAFCQNTNAPLEDGSESTTQPVLLENTRNSAVPPIKQVDEPPVQVKADNPKIEKPELPVTKVLTEKQEKQPDETKNKTSNVSNDTTVPVARRLVPVDSVEKVIQQIVTNEKEDIVSQERSSVSKKVSGDVNVTIMTPKKAEAVVVSSQPPPISIVLPSEAILRSSNSDLKGTTSKNAYKRRAEIKPGALQNTLKRLHDNFLPKVLKTSEKQDALTQSSKAAAAASEVIEDQVMESGESVAFTPAKIDSASSQPAKSVPLPTLSHPVNISLSQVHQLPNVMQRPKLSTTVTTTPTLHQIPTSLQPSILANVSTAISSAALTSVASLSVTTSNSGGQPQTVFAIHPNVSIPANFAQLQQSPVVLPGGHKMVPIKLVTLPKQSSGQLQTIPLGSGTPNRSSPNLLETVNIVANAGSRSSSPKTTLIGNAGQPTPLNLSSMSLPVGGNLHFVPISVSSGTGTTGNVKVLMTQPIKMQQAGMPQSMVVKSVLMGNQPTTIRVIRPANLSDPISIQSLIKPTSDPGTINKTVSPKPDTPVIASTVTKSDFTIQSDSLFKKLDGVEIVDTGSPLNNDELPFEADIIHDEKDLADVLAAEAKNELIPSENCVKPFTEIRVVNTIGDKAKSKPAYTHSSSSVQNHVGSKKLVSVSEVADSPATTMRNTPPHFTYSSSPKLSRELTPATSSPSPLGPDLHGEDEEIINSFSRSPSQPRLSPQNKPHECDANDSKTCGSDHTYGMSSAIDLNNCYNSSSLGQELSIEIPSIDMEVVLSPSQNPAAEGKRCTRSTRSNPRLSPDITAFVSEISKPNKLTTNKLDVMGLRSSPKPSPTGSMKVLSPTPSSLTITPSTSTRSSPILHNQHQINASNAAATINAVAMGIIDKIQGNATAQNVKNARISKLTGANKRKRQESDSSSASRDENMEDKTEIDLNSRPGKRKCSENAAEMIKVCIGVEDSPKRNLSTSVKKTEESKVKDGKGKKTTTPLLEEDDDADSEVSFSRGRSGRSSRESSEDRSSSRGSSAQRMVSTVTEKTKSLKEKEEDTAKDIKNSRVNSRAPKDATSKSKTLQAVKSSVHLAKKSVSGKPTPKRVHRPNSKQKSSLSPAKTRTHLKKDGISAQTSSEKTSSSASSTSVAPDSENARRKTRSSAAGKRHVT